MIQWNRKVRRWVWNSRWIEWNRTDEEHVTEDEEQVIEDEGHVIEERKSSCTIFIDASEDIKGVIRKESFVVKSVGK